MNSLQKNTSLQNGKYMILAVLGQGGFGITYLAEHTLLQKKVAIKEFFLKDQLERDESSNDVVTTAHGEALKERYQRKFLKEARTLLELKHPNIVGIMDVFLENQTAYYVMEYVPGKSLSEIQKTSGKLPEEKALFYLLQVCEALRYLHAHRINHLDIKPANVMVRTADNQAVLIDFGLSKHYDEVGDETSTTPVGISHGYAPLEQYNAGGVSSFYPQTDIYALGATLFKLVEGVTPPAATDILNEGFPKMSDDLSPAVRNAIRQAMQIRRDDRPKDIDEFVQLLKGEGSGAVPPPVEEATLLTPSGNSDLPGIPGDGPAEAVPPVPPASSVSGGAAPVPPVKHRRAASGRWLLAFFLAVCLAGLLAAGASLFPKKGKTSGSNGSAEGVARTEQPSPSPASGDRRDRDPGDKENAPSKEDIRFEVETGENEMEEQKPVASAGDAASQSSMNGEEAEATEEAADNALVEVPAQYPGGEAGLLQFVGDHLVYPASAAEKKLEGTVVVRFRVETDGTVGKVVVKKGFSADCDQAAIEVVSQLQRFIPAKQQGHPVPVWFTLPIRFQIE